MLCTLELVPLDRKGVPVSRHAEGGRAAAVGERLPDGG
jgi:hypothetical protein